MKQTTLLRRALALGALILAGSTRPALAADDIVLYARNAGVVVGAWSRVSDASAAGGARMANPDMGMPKITTPSASPASYFEVTFTTQPGIPYHLWIRGRAQNDSWMNDSAYVQFSGSVNASGSAVYRIGTTSAALYSLEKYSGAGESGWGWQDNGYATVGDPIYFAGTSQTIRVQVREDGLSIDQIVLSPGTYATSAPGAAKNDTTILPENTGSSAPTSGTSSGGSSGASAAGAVVWRNLVNTAASGSTLRKSGGCDGCYDAGAVSQQSLTAGTLSFSVPAGQTLFVGLGRDASAGTAYTAIDYAFKFNGSYWEVRENNIYRTEGSYSASDVFSITLQGTTVTYAVNQSLVYTSQVPATVALMADTSISNVGGTITTASLSGSTTAPAGGGSSGGGSSGGTTAAPATLRVLQWNTHHGGYGTDNVYSPDRLATWAASFNPDVVTFNEIEKNDYWGYQDQPEVYKALLQQKTGKTWYYVFAQEFGQWSANGKGNLILSSYPITISDRYELVHNADRSIAMGVITVNGRDITLMSTHLDPYDASLRLTQANDVTSWAAPQPENRIITGDMNAWPDQTSIAQLTSLYNDSWAVATANGTAVAFPGNNGETKNGRIDYIFTSRSAPNLTVVSSQVYDTRDASGIMPSDHRPVLTTFEVR